MFVWYITQSLHHNVIFSVRTSYQIDFLDWQEEVRNQISTLEADLADKNEKFTSAIARVEKHSEARREMEKKLDLHYQRTV